MKYYLSSYLSSIFPTICWWGVWPWCFFFQSTRNENKAQLARCFSIKRGVRHQQSTHSARSVVVPGWCSDIYVFLGCSALSMLLCPTLPGGYKVVTESYNKRETFELIGLVGQGSGMGTACSCGRGSFACSMGGAARLLHIQYSQIEPR